jgi:hypothetical protein
MAKSPENKAVFSFLPSALSTTTVIPRYRSRKRDGRNQWSRTLDRGLRYRGSANLAQYPATTGTLAVGHGKHVHSTLIATGLVKEP